MQWMIFHKLFSEPYPPNGRPLKKYLYSKVLYATLNVIAMGMLYVL